MPGLLRTRCMVCIAVLLFGLISGLANAQTSASSYDSNLTELVSKLVEPLEKYGARKVIVLDLRPTTGLHPAGARLAENISAVLREKLPNVRFLHNSRSKEAALGSQQESLSDSETGSIVPADVTISGSFGQLDQRLKIALVLKSTDGHFTSPDPITGTIPITQDLISLSSEPLPAFKEELQRPGIGGVSYPRCLSCPPPPYTKEARRAKYEGIVILEIIISAEGKVERVDVVKSPGYGLDETAKETVRSWKFTPTLGPNGKPIRIAVPVEVSFRLTNRS